MVFGIFQNSMFSDLTSSFSESQNTRRNPPILEFGHYSRSSDLKNEHPIIYFHYFSSSFSYNRRVDQRRIVIILRKIVLSTSPTNVSRLMAGSYSARRSSFSQTAVLSARRDQGRSKSAVDTAVSQAESGKREQASDRAEARLQNGATPHQNLRAERPHRSFSKRNVWSSLFRVPVYGSGICNPRRDLG